MTAHLTPVLGEGMPAPFNEALRLRQTWIADQDRLLAAMKDSGTPMEALDFVIVALTQMDERIAQFAKRVLAR